MESKSEKINIVEIHARMERMEIDIVTIKKAFPSGDIDGHRAFHDLQIELLRERRRLRVAIQEKTISGLVWAGIVWGFSRIWHHFGGS